MRIVYTSDTHGHVFPLNYAKNCPENAGLFCIASQIEKDGNTLVIDGGDSLQGTPLISYYIEHKDEFGFNPVAEGFNAMGLDYYTLGNHDFNFGYDVILDYVSNMKAQLICANVEDLRGALGIRKNVIHTLEDGTRVGITGAVTGYVNVWEQKDHLAELKVSDPVKALEEQLSELKGKCDITVCIYHGGFEEDLATGKKLSDITENQACEIARKLDFDILLTGHQHMSVEGVEISGSYGVQPPDKASVFCDLQVKRANDKWDITSKLAKVEAPDERYQKFESYFAKMEELTGRVEKWLDEPIGSLEKEIEPEGKLEAALYGSKVASIFNQVQLDYTGADFSCTSLANDPLGLKKDISVRDVLGIYQFANTVEVKKVTKNVIKKALERCAEYFEIDKETGNICISNVFLQPKVEHYNYDFYAGLEYEFDITKPVGERVTKLTLLGGGELSDDKDYTLVTSNYRATGTGGYECIGNCETVGSYSDEMPDLLIRYLREHSPVGEIVNSKLTVKD